MDETFFMLYVEGGGAPTYKHLNYPTALAEAKRLAAKTEQPVYILEAHSKVELNKFNITQLSSVEYPF
ncbi:MAG: hypothetical protein J5733_09030 [Bacteroidaceae bacterium]|nr:hypothetical protein [Bacteroidaceae bacterium]